MPTPELTQTPIELEVKARGLLITALTSTEGPLPCVERPLLCTLLDLLRPVAEGAEGPPDTLRRLLREQREPTKREVFAALFLQGSVATNRHPDDKRISESLELADRLIRMAQAPVRDAPQAGPGKGR